MFRVDVQDREALLVPGHVFQTRGHGHVVGNAPLLEAEAHDVPVVRLTVAVHVRVDVPAVVREFVVSPGAVQDRVVELVHVAEVVDEQGLVVVHGGRAEEHRQTDVAVEEEPLAVVQLALLHHGGIPPGLIQIHVVQGQPVVVIPLDGLGEELGGFLHHQIVVVRARLEHLEYLARESAPVRGTGDEVELHVQPVLHRDVPVVDRVQHHVAVELAQGVVLLAVFGAEGDDVQLDPVEVQIRGEGVRIIGPGDLLLLRLRLRGIGRRNLRAAVRRSALVVVPAGFAARRQKRRNHQRGQQNRNEFFHE